MGISHLIFISPLPVISVCLSVTCTDTGPVSRPAMPDFRIAVSEHPGWIERQVAEYDTSSLYDIINGGAPPYIARGLVKGIYQRLEHAEGERAAELFVMEFGSARNASDIFNDKRPDSSETVVVGGYPDSVVVASRHLSGVNAYAHFGWFYFELTLSGYTDEAAAVEQAHTFLSEFEEKAN
jgi:hypothetical protein